MACNNLEDKVKVETRPKLILLLLEPQAVL